MKPDHDTIKQIPLFSELSTEELRKFTQISQLKKIFKKGNHLFGGKSIPWFLHTFKGCGANF